MASADISTSSSQISNATSDDRKKSVDEAFLNKMKRLVERLRLDNADLNKALDVERSGVRSLKALQEATIRNIKAEFKTREEFLEKQLRCSKPEKPYEDTHTGNSKLNDLKKLSTEIQSLKASNKSFQEKLKVSQAAECARAAELRAQAARHAALEEAARRDARVQCRKLLEEIKSKERVIIQLRRKSARSTTIFKDTEQGQRMECGVKELGRKLHVDQVNDKSNRQDLKTDIQHRKETFYREPISDEDSAVSSAPPSLSPQPLSDMWSCGQCRLAGERAEAAARECAKLTDALRDARDQIELMEFRLLELEDAAPDKGARDTLTDSDSGCVSPGSRIKDSASPELKRMDSGYKSPHTPSSPCNPRRNMDAPLQDDFKEDFARAQLLADLLDRSSEASDSLRSNPVKEHLEQMILNAGSVEDRSCLEQVLMLLYNLQALSSSVSDDECYQVKSKRSCELKIPKTDADTTLKTQKAVATVTPYSQQSHRGKYESFDSFPNEDNRKPNSVLQESGIFEEVETETRCTQTEVNEPFECNGELNTEIQRLNSIREKLERQGVSNKTLSSKIQDENEGLECRCVKLGKKHKQYYERRLRFLEGKISIYEAAPDVKQAKLAQRLQKEYLLENRIQELESQLSTLQDKYDGLEEDCCELEEIENDTRLHWQQLEMDYELCSAQLRDMTEQRECSRAQAERLMAELSKRERTLKTREIELKTRLEKLEKAVPALIAWNVLRVVGADIPYDNMLQLKTKLGPVSQDTKCTIEQIKLESENKKCNALVTWKNINMSPSDPAIKSMEEKVRRLMEEKNQIESEMLETKRKLEATVKELEEQLETTKRQITAVECGSEYKKEKLQSNILKLEGKIKEEKNKGELPADHDMEVRLHILLKSEQELKARVLDLEKREKAYLEMLTQADDMWAEMEGGYKKKIDEAHETEYMLRGQVKQIETHRDEYKKYFDQLNKKLREIEESEMTLRVALDKSERDAKALKSKNKALAEKTVAADEYLKKSEASVKELEEKFKKEVENLRKQNKVLNQELSNQKETTQKNDKALKLDLDTLRKELNRTYKNVQELEVTNSELREEVESLEKQLGLTQKALSQCKRKCEEKVKILSHELSIKTEELEELRCETIRQSLQAARIDLNPDKNEYIDEGYTLCTAVPKKMDYGRMHNSMSYISSDTRCSCPSMRSQLVGSLIEDLFNRIHSTVDDDLTRLCKEIVQSNRNFEMNGETKAKISNYLLMAISKELVRSIGDADAKTDTEEWQRAVSSMTYSVPDFCGNDTRKEFSAMDRLEGNAGVLNGASRLASVTCACAAARLCTALPELSDSVKTCQEEVLDHSDVKIMEEQLANAIESIVNCPSCALGTNAIVWSTDV